MKRRLDLFTPITILTMIITSLSGIFSWNLTKAYDVVNQYGETVRMYGYAFKPTTAIFRPPFPWVRIFASCFLWCLCL